MVFYSVKYLTTYIRKEISKSENGLLIFKEIVKILQVFKGKEPNKRILLKNTTSQKEKEKQHREKRRFGLFYSFTSEPEDPCSREHPLLPVPRLDQM